LIAEVARTIRPRNITLHTLLIERVMRVIRHREEEIDPSWGRARERHRASDPMLSTLH